jgi:hypothetical protein
MNRTLADTMDAANVLITAIFSVLTISILRTNRAAIVTLYDQMNKQARLIMHVFKTFLHHVALTSPPTFAVCVPIYNKRNSIYG